MINTQDYITMLTQDIAAAQEEKAYHEAQAAAREMRIEELKRTRAKISAESNQVKIASKGGSCHVCGGSGLVEFADMPYSYQVCFNCAGTGIEGGRADDK